MAPTSYEVKALTDPGIKRRAKPNQDSVGTVLPGLFQRRPPLLILADGMGGYQGGQVASQTIVRVLTQRYLNADLGNSALPFFKETVSAAHRDILDTASKNPELAKMGSTVVAVVLYPDHVDLVNVGDSRAYLIRENQLLQISQDQSMVADKVRQGLLTEKEALRDPQRNRLTMSLSAMRTTVEPFFNSFRLEPGDVILLCSDGLWGSVSEPLIHSVAANFPPSQAAPKLIELANKAGGVDNISVIIAMPTEQVKSIARQKPGQPA